MEGNQMLNQIRQAFIKANEITLGEKKVQIEKITPAMYKRIFGVVGSLPSLILTVAQAPKEQAMEYLLNAAEIGMEDIVAVTSELTGIDADYLMNETGLDDLVEYFSRMVEYNNLERLAKNVKSLLPKFNEKNESSE
jgi:hypothetical protein